MRKTEPYVDRLRRDLDEIAAMFDELLGASSITRSSFNQPGDTVIVVAPGTSWSASTPEVAALQMQMLGVYSDWFQRLSLLFSSPRSALRTQLKNADEAVRSWVDRGEMDWTIPTTIERARTIGAERIDEIRRLLDLAAAAGAPGLRLIPDTNALLRNPDLASYARTFEGVPFTVHLIPTVMSELDNLKDQGKSPEVRDKARLVSRRLKGLRDKGDLSRGVNLTKSIVVKAEAREPQVKSVIDWLDPTVPDDRIAATALRLQSDHPAGTVILVTSDMNLQTKADAIGLPYVETPPVLESLRANLTAEISSIGSDSSNASSRVTLTNAGPATARDLEYRVSSPGGPPKFTAGPWSVKKLHRNDSDVQNAYLVASDPAEVTATWTDDEGPQKRTWLVPFLPGSKG